MQKERMNVSELAQYIGVSKSKIYKLIKEKKVPASRIGRQYKFSKQLIDAWLKENTVMTTSSVSLFQPNKKIIRGGEKHGKEKSSQEEGDQEKSS